MKGLKGKQRLKTNISEKLNMQVKFNFQCKVVRLQSAKTYSIVVNK